MVSFVPWLSDYNKRKVQRWNTTFSIRIVANFKALAFNLPLSIFKDTDFDFSTKTAIIFIHCCMSVISFRSEGVSILFDKFGLCADLLSDLAKCIDIEMGIIIIL